MSGQTIVSLAPSATETIAAMGATNRLAAVTSHCSVDAPEVGGWLNPAYDRIQEIDPDIICTNDELQREGRDELRDRGFTVFHQEPSRLDEVVDGFHQLGAAIGESDAGHTLAEESRERLEHVEQAVAGKSRPVVYCEEWADPPMAAGNWVPDAVERAGGRYPFIQPGERSAEVSQATVESEDPAHAILHICGAGDRVSPNRITERGWDINPTVHVLDDSLLNQPSPRLIDGIELLAERIHADV